MNISLCMRVSHHLLYIVLNLASMETCYPRRTTIIIGSVFISGVNLVRSLEGVVDPVKKCQFHWKRIRFLKKNRFLKQKNFDNFFSHRLKKCHLHSWQMSLFFLKKPLSNILSVQNRHNPSCDLLCDPHDSQPQIWGS